MHPNSKFFMITFETPTLQTPEDFSVKTHTEICEIRGVIPQSGEENLCRIKAVIIAGHHLLFAMLLIQLSGLICSAWSESDVRHFAFGDAIECSDLFGV